MQIFVNFLIALGIIGLIVLALYLFEKYISPIDPKVKGILIFLAAIVIIIYLVTGGSLMFWRR